MKTPHSQQELKTQLSACLLKAAEPAEFVRQALELTCELNPKANYAQLARKMGFSSRSFVRQLALGKRRPNLSNFKKIALGLELSNEATEYFGLIVEKHQSAPVSPQLSRRINEAELRLRRSLQKQVRRVRRTDLVASERWPFIYAALGTAQTGRKLQDIIRISGQEPKLCVEILDFLIAKGLVDFDSSSQRYFPREEVIDIGELGESRILKNLYQLISLEALRRVVTDLNKEECLFHSSVFSVNARRLPQLTRDLQRVLASYAAEAEDSEGEELAMLSAAFIPLNRKT